MRLLSRLAFPVAVLTLAALASSTGKTRAETGGSGPTLAFTSVNLLPMTAGEPILRDQTVLVKHGRIAAVGPSASVRVPKEAMRINGRGKYLMPGLTDMHVHLEHFDHPAYLKMFLVHGVTMVRSMDGRPAILEWKKQAASGRLESPDIHTAGQVLDGSPPRRDDNIALATPEQAKLAVERQAAAGYDFIKVYDNLAADAFQAIRQAAAALNMPIVGHVPNSVPLDAFLASGVRSIEHLSDFADAIAAPQTSSSAPPASLKRRLGFRADEKRMEMLARKVASSGVWVVPTLITDDHLVASAASVDEWAKDREARTVDRGILNGYWRGTVLRAAGRLGPADWRWVDEGKANRTALVRSFHRAGVGLLIGTDTPQPYVFAGRSVHDELGNYVAAGLTPAEALAAATREPARFLHQEDSWGTIEIGKRADLLLLDANPLADIAATRRIAGMMKGGRWMPAARLQQLRQEVESVAAKSE